MKYERAQEWKRLFRVMLGVSPREAHDMFARLIRDRQFIERRSGVWGIMYALKRE